MWAGAHAQARAPEAARLVPADGGGVARVASQPGAAGIIARRARLNGRFFRRASSRQRRRGPSAGDGAEADVDGRALCARSLGNWRSRGTWVEPGQDGPSAQGLGHELASGPGTCAIGRD